MIYEDTVRGNESKGVVVCELMKFVCGRQKNTPGAGGPTPGGTAEGVEITSS